MMYEIPSRQVICDHRLHMTFSDDHQRLRRNAGLFKIRQNIRKIDVLRAGIGYLAQRLSANQ